MLNSCLVPRIPGIMLCYVATCSSCWRQGRSLSSSWKAHVPVVVRCRWWWCNLVAWRCDVTCGVWCGVPGKMLPPKLGLLDMCVEPYVSSQAATGDLQIVPVSVDYERVLEGDMYAHEVHVMSYAIVNRVVTVVTVIHRCWGRQSVARLYQTSSVPRLCCVTATARWW